MLFFYHPCLADLLYNMRLYYPIVSRYSRTNEVKKRKRVLAVEKPSVLIQQPGRYLEKAPE